jgi:hypothetical protein
MLHSILIAASLLLLLLLGVLALFMAGNRQDTASCERPDEKDDDFNS